VERLIVLDQGTGEIVMGERADRFVDGLGRQSEIEFDQSGAQVALEHHVAGVGAAQCALRSKSFLIPGVDAVPAQRLFQVFGEGSALSHF
jgi:hypothetical protein